MNKEALQNYQRCKGKKWGVLVTNGHYFYLYDQQFCPVNQLHLFVDSPNFKVDCHQPNGDCFFWTDGEAVHFSTPSGTLPPTTHAWALTHIQSTDGGDLRVILYAEDGNPLHLLFSDEGVERLFLQLVRRKSPALKPTQTMTDLSALHHDNAMELLTQLYLQSAPLEQLTTLKSKDGG